MEKKKEYQHPAVEVVEFKSKVQLMDGTAPESIDPEPGPGSGGGGY